MIIVEKIQKNRVYLSNHEMLDMSYSLIRKYNLKINDNIESLYDDISYEAYFEKAIFLLNLKDRTKKEIKEKLNRKYKNRKMIQKVAEKLVESGYINDLDYAVSYILGKKYGRERIFYALLQKGISKETVEEAYLFIEENYEKNMEERKLEKAVSKNIEKEERKLIQYLIRQGFEPAKIFSKIKEYKKNGKWEGEDY